MTPSERLDWSGLFPENRRAQALAQDYWRALSTYSGVLEAAQEGKMFGLLLGEYQPKTQAQLDLEPPSELKSLVKPSHLVRHEQRSPQGSPHEVVLFACSGQLGGLWEPRGWAPSLLNHQRVAGQSWRTQRDLHRLTSRIKRAQLISDQSEVVRLKQLRRERSRVHARELHDETWLTPLKGSPVSLSDYWPHASVGVGECCAPKLLCWAAQLGVIPSGLVEFQFVSHDHLLSSLPKSSPRAQLINTLEVSQGALSFYTPCEPRCQPILPFLLGLPT